MSEPPPAHWAAIVRDRVPISKKLRSEDFERLLKLIQVFLAKKNIEGAGGFDVTEEAAITIAAQACLLLIWRNTGMYPGLRTIIVYPSATIPKMLDSSTGGFEESLSPIVGQSWGAGVVILSWDSADFGAFDPRDGKNVVLHEFAHQLDQETGEADGMPVGLPLSAVKPWAEVMEKHFRLLRSADRKGRKTVLDGYGATNYAEFFAVATEAFFEKPERLRHTKPDLYGLLTDFYGVDPADGMRGMGDGLGMEDE
ncbi:MAG: zinc-dependent peptidase [Gemmatimonadetes bacterium]|nr:zinc-dependent peptidase [Gemmatimonadota bacterium]